MRHYWWFHTGHTRAPGYWRYRGFSTSSIGTPGKRAASMRGRLSDFGLSSCPGPVLLVGPRVDGGLQWHPPFQSRPFSKAGQSMKLLWTCPCAAGPAALLTSYAQRAISATFGGALERKPECSEQEQKGGDGGSFVSRWTVRAPCSAPAGNVFSRFHDCATAVRRLSLRCGCGPGCGKRTGKRGWRPGWVAGSRRDGPVSAPESAGHGDRDHGCQCGAAGATQSDLRLAQLDGLA
jgi:hypothetical protein